MTPKGVERLKLDEGNILFVYDDNTDKTFGYGPDGGIPTIGYGRNLAPSGRGITQAESEYLLANDIAECEAHCLINFPWLAPKGFILAPALLYRTVDMALPVRGDVVTMVCYNTGSATHFPKMMAALEAGDWKAAAAELMNSGAARELHERYSRMRDAILDGVWNI